MINLGGVFIIYELGKCPAMIHNKLIKPLSIASSFIITSAGLGACNSPNRLVVIDKELCNKPINQIDANQLKGLSTEQFIDFCKNSVKQVTSPSPSSSPVTAISTPTPAKSSTPKPKELFGVTPPLDNKGNCAWPKDTITAALDGKMNNEQTAFFRRQTEPNLFADNSVSKNIIIAQEIKAVQSRNLFKAVDPEIEAKVLQDNLKDEGYRKRTETRLRNCLEINNP